MNLSKKQRILKILETEDIRYIDARYSKGFVDDYVLNEMVMQEEVDVYKKQGLVFVRLKN